MVDKDHIYSEEHRGLVGYALKMLNDPTYALDVLQQVYVYLNKRSETSFKDSKHVTHWLIWMTKTLCYDFNRKNGRYVHLEQEIIDTKISSEDTPSEHTDRQDINKVLRKSLNFLSPMQRKAVVMYYLDGKDRHEIASLLNTNPATVNVSIAKGVKALKTKFKTVQDMEQ